MDKKKLLIVLAVVVVGGGIGYYLYSRKSNSPASASILPAGIVAGGDPAAKERKYIMDHITTHGHIATDIERIRIAPPEIIVKMYEALLAHNNAGESWAGIEKLNSQWENAWVTVRSIPV